MSHLSDYLGLHYLNIPVDTHKLLQRLQMFKQSDNVHDEEMVSIKENHLSLEACEFPKDLTYPNCEDGLYRSFTRHITPSVASTNVTSTALCRTLSSRVGLFFR
jgi:hypothetical protein